MADANFVHIPEASFWFGLFVLDRGLAEVLPPKIARGWIHTGVGALALLYGIGWLSGTVIGIAVVVVLVLAGVLRYRRKVSATPKAEVAEPAVSTATTPRFIAVPLPSFVAALGAIGIGAAIGVGGWWLLSTLQTTSSPQQSPPSVQNRSFINVSPDYLIQILRDHTDVQGQKLLQQYMGEWMKIEGTVANVASVSGSAIVILNVHNSIRPPFSFGLAFNKDWFDRASSLTIGDRIVVIGRLYEIDLASLRLTDCEFQFSQHGK